MARQGYTRDDFGALGILQNLNRFVGKTTEAVREASEQVGRELVEHANATHPWQNQTGFLESSTRYEVIQQGQDVVTVLYAGEDIVRKNYAIFLELFMSGNWTWLLPAMIDMQDRIMEIYKEHLNVTVRL